MTPAPANCDKQEGSMMPPEAIQNNAFPNAHPTVTMAEPLRLVLLLLPPLLLAGLETLHPQPEPTVQAMLDAQRPGSPRSTPFSLFSSASSRCPCLSWPTPSDARTRGSHESASVSFMVFFSAYDTLAGIGTGLAMRKARDLSATQQDGILARCQDWPGFGPPFALSILGTAGWVIAVGALALTAYRQRIPRRVWIALGLAALFYWADTRSRPERLAFGSFFIAAFLLEWSSHRHPELRSEPGERRL